MKHLKLLWVFLLIANSSFCETGYVYPLMSPKISSDYGKRYHPIRKIIKHHAGIDLAAPLEAPIRAISSGFVIFSGMHGGYGNLVVLMHKDGITSHYGHCQTLSVNVGEQIKAGSIIATVGDTGKVTGPHLHLEIRKDGAALDPEKVIPGLAELAEG